MNSEPERYLVFQFWLSDHDGNRLLFDEWSDGEIAEASRMVPELIVDIQNWDAQSGVILNHLVDAGWQVGTIPYGINDDEPIPKFAPDHETLFEREPAGAPFTPGQTSPNQEAVKPTPQTPPGPGQPTTAPPDPRQEPGKTAKWGSGEGLICVLPATSKRASFSHAPEPASGLLSSLCSLCLLGLICLIGTCHSGGSTNTKVNSHLLVGENFVADSLIKSLRQAEQQRIDQGWKEELEMRALYAPWIDAHPGQWYTIKWGSNQLRIRSKGTLRKLSELPTEGNQLGDFYNVEGQAHIFVWTTPRGASAPTWVDP